MSRAPVSIDATVPFPPRYWWLKHITAGVLMILMLLVLVRLIWGWDANRRLQNEIAAIRARGEPILPEEFNTPHVPDAQNAVFYLKQASAAISPNADPPAATNMEYPNYLPMSAEWYAVAKKAVTVNAPALQLARQARQQNKVDWGIKYTSPINATIVYPSLNQQRHLANLLGDSALYYHLTGNDAEAMETLRDLLAQADVVKQQQSLVARLVLNGFLAVANDRLEVIAPGLRLADDPSPAPATQPSTPATRAQVQEIITLLLKHSEADWRATMIGERMFALDNGLSMTKHSFVLRPMYQIDLIRTIRSYARYIAATTQPTFWQALAMLPPSDAAPKNTGELPRLLSSFYYFSDRVYTIDFRVRMEDRLAAVSLATRLYQIDHNGRWPASLQELVPNYLPTVPADPLSRTDAPLGYVIFNNDQRPIVYSVGDGGYDYKQLFRGGSATTLPATPMYSWQTTDNQWRDLSRFAPPPTTQPAADDQVTK